jgi:hypothetical protein
MQVLNNYKTAELNYLNSKNQLMQLLASKNGFYTFYKSVLPSHVSETACFNYCNVNYKMLFGEFRFKSISDFQKAYLLNTSELELKRNFILGWYHLKGFRSFENFYPVVLVIFPELTKDRLLKFWNKSTIDVEVLDKVECVKQIIG